jgi:hypothetical protein
VIQPRRHADAEEVAAAEDGTRGEVHLLQRGGREPGDVGLEDLVPVERPVLERVLLVVGLGQVLLVESLAVDDEDAARLEIVDVDAERRRIHRDQHVEVVAGREDVLGREVQLEGADARQRAGRRPDLRGKVRQGGEVVAASADSVVTACR